jgi:hypothetical protein
MNLTINERREYLQRGLVASARLRNDGMVIYSQEGMPPIEDQEMPLEQVKIQLECNGASPEKADQFVNDLQRLGVAELREHVSISSVSVL